MRHFEWRICRQQVVYSVAFIEAGDSVSGTNHRIFCPIPSRLPGYADARLEVRDPVVASIAAFAQTLVDYRGVIRSPPNKLVIHRVTVRSEAGVLSSSADLGSSEIAPQPPNDLRVSRPQTIPHVPIAHPLTDTQVVGKPKHGIWKPGT